MRDKVEGDELGTLEGSPESLSRRAVQAALLAWYDRVCRPLPWRLDDPDPYAIAVSEFMLQQTRVETARPRFEAFLRRFPTVEALAEASEDDVLAEWSGLGYYRRARNLRRAAIEIGRRGGWPRTADGLRELPGFGEYTAAAVASIAFDEPVAALDGNVERVFARRLALREDPKRASARRTLRLAADEWISEARPGDSNQALMELGATVCSPRRPRCGECPVRPGCLGADSGTPEDYPVPRKRRDVVTVAIVALLVEREGGFLLFRRSRDESLLSGLWEIPWVEPGAGAGETERRFAARYGGTWRLGRTVGRLSHSITHRRLDVEVLRGRVLDPGEAIGEGPEAGWYPPEAIAGLPGSSLLDKIVRSGSSG